jgi:hypothetical protein
MGRTYHFVCSHCHYWADVSGGMDGGIHCSVQTVACRECRELRDVFTKLRRRADTVVTIKFPGFFRPEIPPVILRDPADRRPLVWESYPLACPVEAKHFVTAWNDPDRCPRCGNFMEKTGAPFRRWD